MDNALNWQTQAVAQLNQIFAEDPDVKALILVGSLAATGVQVDEWSDIDAKIILADHAVDRYFVSSDWLPPIGRVIGAERYEDSMTKTVRVCMEGLRRFDLTSIIESAWNTPTQWDHNPIPAPYTVMWSRLPDVEERLDSFPPPADYQDVSHEEIQKMVDSFWFKVSVAIAKVVRNDLLIGLHLALGLAQDCLVLQMIRRDHEKKTTIHRLGGWGNEIAAHFEFRHQDETGVEILKLIQLNGEIFDDLAFEMVPNYSKRGSLLEPSIASAKRAIQEGV